MTNEARHTPGPWTFEYDNSESSGGGQWYDIRACRAGGGDGHNVLWCSYNSGREETIKANARLAASAPLLLEALQECRTKLEAFVGAVCEITDCSEDVEALKRADAAISSALQSRCEGLERAATECLAAYDRNKEDDPCPDCTGTDEGAERK